MDIMDFHLHRKLLLILCGNKKKKQSERGGAKWAGPSRKGAGRMDIHQIY